MTQVTGSRSELYQDYDPLDLYVESAAARSANCRATGHHHITTFDGKYWHYYDGNRRNPTRVTLYKSTKRDFVVQVQVRGNPAGACAIAGREGNDRVMINNCGGGIQVEADFHTKKADDQPRIDSSGNTYTVYFKSGAWMRAQVTGWGLNVWTESVDPGSSCGMCGNFNGNSGDDSTGDKIYAYERLFECQMVSSAAYKTRTPCKNGANSRETPSCDIWEYEFEEGDDNDENTLPPPKKYCPYEPTVSKPLIGAQDVEDITDFVKQHTEEEQNRGIAVFDIENGNFEVAKKYDTKLSAKACADALDTKMVKECSLMDAPGGAEFKEMFDEILADCTQDYSTLGGPREVSQIEDGDKELLDSISVLEKSCIELFIRYGYRNCQTKSCVALKNVLCPQGCSGHGECANAACQCDDGWAGKACDADTSKPPTFADMDAMVCDTQSSKGFCYARDEKNDKCKDAETEVECEATTKAGGTCVFAPGCPSELAITGAGFFCNKTKCKYDANQDVLNAPCGT